MACPVTFRATRAAFERPGIFQESDWLAMIPQLSTASPLNASLTAENPGSNLIVSGETEAGHAGEHPAEG